MPRKKLQNRIENLFAELKVAQDEVQESPEPVVPDLNELLSEPTESEQLDAQQEILIKKKEGLESLGNEIKSSQPDQPVGPESIKKPRKKQVRDSQLNHKTRWNENEATQSQIKVPFSIRGRSEAFLEVQDVRPELAWSDNERKLVEQVADQLSIALENAYLFQETQLALAEAKALYTISRAATHSINLDETLQLMLMEILNAVSLDAGLISILERTPYQWEIAASMNLGKEFLQVWKDISADTSVSESLDRSQKPILAADLLETIHEELWWLLDGELREQLVESGIISIYSAPIYSKGILLGILVLFGFSSWRQYETSSSLLEAASQQVGIVIENARLYSKEKERRRVADALVELAGLVSSSLDLEEVSDRILTNLKILVDYQVASIQLLKNGKRVLAAWSASEHLDGEYLNQHILAGFIGELVNEAASSRIPVLIRDTSSDPRWSVRESILDIGTWLCLPLLAGEDVLGFLVVEQKQPGAYTQETSSLAMAFASQAAIAIRNASLFEMLQDSFSEAEKLYQATSEMNAVQSYQDILEIFIRNTILGSDPFKANSLYLFEKSRILGDKDSTGIQKAADSIKPDNPVEISRDFYIEISELAASQINTVIGTQEQIVVIHDFLNQIGISTEWTVRFTEACPSVSVAYIPLVFGGRWLGVIQALSLVPVNIDPADQRHLLTLASQASTAIQNLSLLEETRRSYQMTQEKMQELSQLYSVSRALSSATMQTSEIAHAVVQEYVSLFGVERASLLLHETGANSLRVLAVAIKTTNTSGEPDSSLVQLEDTPNGSLLLSYYPAVEEVMQSLHPLILQREDDLFPIFDIQLSIDDPALASELILKFTQTLILIPLAVKGRSIGIIQLESSLLEPKMEFDPSQINLAMTIANAAAVVLENAQLYEAQLETSQQLRELDKLKSQFLANMSHELRTPLNSIIGFSRVILKGIDGPVNDVQQQDLTAIHNAGTHLLELINDVLDVSKIEAGKMELAFDDEVSLPVVIDSAMSTAVGLTKDKPIRLERLIEDDLPLVKADPTRIRQVLINFLSNAAKFTDQGVITVRAYRSAHSEPGKVPVDEIRVSVSDTGPGISKEDQAKLFRPFSQVDYSPTRKVGGSGLGLSISRLLVELHGGSIGVESEPGQGSTFYFSLPLQLADEAGTSLEQSDSEAVAQASLENTILIIDDDRQVIRLYERYLRNSGYNTVSVSDPIQAVEKARSLRPFAITLDIMMPRMDGWQVLDALKHDPETKSIPVIICSILENEEKGLSLGAVDYLHKPVLEEDLIQALNRLSGEFDEIDVLIIDDDPDVLRLIKKVLLGSERYKVRTAQNGTEGLVAVQTRPPDIVILDLMMPEIDGFTVLEMMKQDSVLRDIPVVIFTAAELDENQRLKLKNWSVDYLYKSEIKSEEFLRSIRSALKKIAR